MRPQGWQERYQNSPAHLDRSVTRICRQSGERNAGRKRVTNVTISLEWQGLSFIIGGKLERGHLFLTLKQRTSTHAGTKPGL